MMTDKGLVLDPICPLCSQPGEDLAVPCSVVRKAAGIIKTVDKQMTYGYRAWMQHHWQL